MLGMQKSDVVTDVTIELALRNMELTSTRGIENMTQAEYGFEDQLVVLGQDGPGRIGYVAA